MKEYIPHNLPTIFDEEITEVENLLSNLVLTLGSKVREFEKAFEKYISLPSAAVNSGTSALHLALEVLGVRENAKVLIPSYTCVTVVLPILYQKAIPFLVDIDTDFNISLEEVERYLTKDIKAVIVPHMFGYPADIKPIKEVCEEKGVYLIEDCAQSLGAEYEGKKVGTLGDISIFSFYATKMITSIQGGMVCSKDKELIEEIKELTDVEGDPKDDRIKFRYTMSDINAAVGITQLKRIDSFIKRRRKISKIYREILEDTDIILPEESKNKKHVYHRFVVRTKFDPELIKIKLYKNGIATARMHYPPLYRRELLRRYCKRSFPKTDEIAESSISLPIYPSLSDEKAIYIASTVKKTLKEL